MLPLPVQVFLDGYLPMHYGDQPPDDAGRDVYLLDFSFKRAVLLDLAANAGSVTVLDHHKTAAAGLTGIDEPHVLIVFDTQKSGARQEHNAVSSRERSFDSSATGTIVAQVQPQVFDPFCFTKERYAMADTKGKIKDKIDEAADKAKEATEKASDAIKGAAKKVGQKVKDAGEKLKAKGG